jgi:hypothetical protein
MHDATCQRHMEYEIVDLVSRQRDNADEGRKYGRMLTRLRLPSVSVEYMPSRHDDELSTARTKSIADKGVEMFKFKPAVCEKRYHQPPKQSIYR